MNQIRLIDQVPNEEIAYIMKYYYTPVVGRLAHITVDREPSNKVLSLFLDGNGPAVDDAIFLPLPRFYKGEQMLIKADRILLLYELGEKLPLSIYDLMDIYNAIEDHSYRERFLKRLAYTVLKNMPWKQE